MANQNERGRVIGIGGIFFKSGDPGRLKTWYAENLGIQEGPAGVSFEWRTVEEPAAQHQTVWCVFPGESKYFEGPSMINYIVDDLDAVLDKLRAAGGTIDPKREEHEYGRFGWAYDPDGNRIELWEPKG